MRGRWLAVGGLSVFALGVALGGAVRRRAAVVPAPAPSARVSAATGAGASDACRAAVKECLLGDLPHDFDPSKYPQVHAAVAKCLGKTPEEIAAKGVKRVHFGRDTRNGLGVDLVRALTGDRIPEDTTTAVVYTKPLPRDECLCVGGGLMGYAGCGPAPGPKRGLGSVITPSRRMRGRFDVVGGSYGSRLQEAGFDQREALLSADGVPIKSAADARKIMLRFPYSPPRTITLGTVYGDRTEIRYVGWDVIQRLAEQVHELKQRYGVPKFCCKSSGHKAIIVGRVSILLGCHDAATEAWLAFARTLGAVRATPGAPRGPEGFPGCSALRDTPTTYYPLSGPEQVMIKYVGWLGVAPGAGRDGGN